ncbi:MAG: hypothetical protein U9R42_06895 [Bacteroidota bacterium]|nr:hypothetical protein [Bacteroidota bacterium]
MRIIADTNIWYELGHNEELFNKIKNEPICPTYTNIYELSISENVVQKEEYVILNHNQFN